MAKHMSPMEGVLGSISVVLGTQYLVPCQLIPTSFSPQLNVSVLWSIAKKMETWYGM